MKYNIHHETTYTYSAPVAFSHNQVHLVPRDHQRQQCLVSRQHITPTPSVVRSWTDYFGNSSGFFVIEHPHRKLTIISESVVEVTPPVWPNVEQSPSWETVRDLLATPTDDDARGATAFRFASLHARPSLEANAYASESFPPGRPILAAVFDLTQRIWRDFEYDPTATAISTPTVEVLRLRRGVCQDFAHLQIACLRGLGLSARYVSGYLLTDPPPGQVKMVGADASHAWLSVWSPGAGWIDFDPTNGCLPMERHVTLSWGRDYSDVSPVKGVVLGGGEHAMRVGVDVSVAAG